MKLGVLRNAKIQIQNTLLHKNTHKYVHIHLDQTLRNRYKVNMNYVNHFINLKIDDKIIEERSHVEKKKKTEKEKKSQSYKNKNVKKETNFQFMKELRKISSMRSFILGSDQL